MGQSAAYLTALLSDPPRQKSEPLALQSILTSFCKELIRIPETNRLIASITINYKTFEISIIPSLYTLETCLLMKLK